MNKFLFLALWMWLPTAWGDFLLCMNCDHQRPGSPCGGHKPPCRLFVGESCFTKTIFFGRMPLYMEKGCLLNCVPMQEPKRPVALSESISCCSETSYCNR